MFSTCNSLGNRCLIFDLPGAVLARSIFISAAILGSKILEIHVTSDKKKNFVDNQVSYDFNELGNLINIIKLSEKIKK